MSQENYAVRLGVLAQALLPISNLPAAEGAASQLDGEQVNLGYAGKQRTGSNVQEGCTLTVVDAVLMTGFLWSCAKFRLLS